MLLTNTLTIIEYEGVLNMLFKTYVLNMVSSVWCLFCFYKRKMRPLLYFPEANATGPPFVELPESTMS